MVSLFDDLESKLQRDPRRMRRGGPRYDLGLLLFNARESIRQLWAAAEEDIRTAEADGRRTEARRGSVTADLRFETALIPVCFHLEISAY